MCYERADYEAEMDEYSRGREEEQEAERMEEMNREWGEIGGLIDKVEAEEQKKQAVKEFITALSLSQKKEI